MTVAGKGFEHADGVGGILRLTEQVVANDDGGIRAEDGLMWGRGYRQGFLLGQPENIIFGFFTGPRGLVDGRAADYKRNARLAQDFRTPWRLGGQDQHFYSVE